MSRRQRSRWRAAVTVLAAVLIAVAGCGVPSGGKPVVDGIPSNVPAIGGGGVPPVAQPDRYQASGPAAFVAGYLGAVEGQVTASGQTVAAEAFMGTAPRWHAKIVPESATPAPVTLIRIVVTPRPSTIGGTTTVKEEVQVFGTYDPASGSISPTPPKPLELVFTVRTDASTSRMVLESAPNGFYMTDVELNGNYTAQNVYFWDTGHSLIPDLRYLPNWMSASRRATAVVKWILAGPPDWMGSAAIGRFSNVSLALPSVGIDGDQFVIDVNTMPANQEADFIAEVRWSLFQPESGLTVAESPEPSLPTVSLEINNLNVPVSLLEDTSVNQAYSRLQDPIAYAIDAGVVRPYGEGHLGGSVQAFGDTEGAPADSTKTLASAANKNVVLAAMHNASGDEVDAAFVRAGADGTEQLWVSRAKGGVKAKFVPLAVTGKAFARPVWLPPSDGTGELAVVADGKLYLVAAANNAITQVAVPGLADPITAFSVGPDGHQIAFVAGNQIWIGLLTVGTTPSVTQPRGINLTPELTTVTAVAWGEATQLVAGGTGATGVIRNDEALAIEAFTDGNYNGAPVLRPSGYLGATSISQLVSYPFSPLDPEPRASAVMVQTGETGAYGGRASPPALIWPSKKPATNPFFED